jgi:hypothetical protein
VRFLGALRTLQQAIRVAAQIPGSDMYGAFESIELQKLEFLAGMGPRCRPAVSHCNNRRFIAVCMRNMSTKKPIAACARAGL